MAIYKMPWIRAPSQVGGLLTPKYLFLPTLPYPTFALLAVKLRHPTLPYPYSLPSSTPAHIEKVNLSFAKEGLYKNKYSMLFVPYRTLEA